MTKTPHNLNSEALVLGTALDNNETFNRIPHLLTEHFYSDTHAAIWAAMLSMRREGLAVTGPALEEYFSGREADAGGIDYLINLPSYAAYGFDEVMTEVRVIVDTYQRRQLIDLSERIRREALGEGEGYTYPSKVIDALDCGLDKIRSQVTGSLPEYDFNSSGLEGLSLSDTAGERLISTGFSELDRHLGGLEEGTVTTLAAATSMGKSSLAICMAINAMRNGETVGYFTLEMTRHAMALRGGSYLLHDPASRDNVTYNSVITGRADESTKTRLKRVFEDTAHNRLYLDDRGGLTTNQMSEQYRAWEAMSRRRGVSRPRLIVIDHMGNMLPNVNRRDATQNTSAVSKDVLAFAKRHKVAVLELCQVVRDVGREGRRPTLHDLRQSGEIEEDAHAVMFLYREEYYAKRDADDASSEDAYKAANKRWMDCKGKAEVIIAKNRNGPLDTVTLLCDIGSNAFHDNRSNVSPIYGRAS